MSAQVKVLDFTSVPKNSLVGFCKVQFPSGMIVYDVSIHGRDGEGWASPPSKPTLGRGGTPLRDADGKLRYAPIITFATHDGRDAFPAAIIAALRAQRPEVFAA